MEVIDVIDSNDRTEQQGGTDDRHLPVGEEPLEDRLVSEQPADEDPPGQWQVRTVQKVLRPDRQERQDVRPEDVRVRWRPAGRRAEGLIPGPRQAEALQRQSKKGDS